MQTTARLPCTPTSEELTTRQPKALRYDDFLIQLSLVFFVLFVSLLREMRHIQFPISDVCVRLQLASSKLIPSMAVGSLYLWVCFLTMAVVSCGLLIAIFYCSRLFNMHDLDIDLLFFTLIREAQVSSPTTQEILWGMYQALIALYTGCTIYMICFCYCEPIPQHSRQIQRYPVSPSNVIRCRC